jgi:hypothetical protein
VDHGAGDVGGGSGAGKRRKGVARAAVCLSASHFVVTACRFVFEKKKKNMERHGPRAPWLATPSDGAAC